MLHIKLIICSLREGAGHRVLNPARACSYLSVCTYFYESVVAEQLGKIDNTINSPDFFKKLLSQK